MSFDARSRPKAVFMSDVESISAATAAHEQYLLVAIGVNHAVRGEQRYVRAADNAWDTNGGSFD
jgi:hypothetical protein